MKSFPLSRILFLFSMLFLSSCCKAQTCPPGSGEFIPDTRTTHGKVSKSITQGPNEEVLNCWCIYRSNLNSGRKISFVTSWVEKAGPTGATGFNNMCNPNPVSIEAMEINTKYEVHVPGKAVMATVIAGDADLVTAKSMARQFISTMESRAVRCKNQPAVTVTGGNAEGNTTDCKQKLDRLKKLEQEKWGISGQLKSLQDGSFDVNNARDRLSHFSKLAAAVKEYDETGNYNGNMYTEVNRLKNDPAYRSFLAKENGINPDFPALKIVRSVRDQWAARIDYFNAAPGLKNRYAGDLTRIHFEISQLHREIELRACPGQYDINSCDLTGDWVISEWDSEDPEKFVTTWTFIPAGKGQYTAFNKRTGRRADAEIFAHEVVFRSVTGNGNIKLNYTISEDCNSSSIRKTYPSGDFEEYITIQRKQKAAGSYIQDMLYEIPYDGITYQGLYNKETKNGIPIDVFYFRILHPGGFQIEQDGKRLWGRFVRDPSVTHSNQSQVSWWFVNWVFESDKWVMKETSIPVELLIK